MFVSAVPATASTVLALFYLPETPRWYLDRRRFAEAEEVVREVARVNGTELAPFSFVPLPLPLPLPLSLSLSNADTENAGGDSESENVMSLVGATESDSLLPTANSGNSSGSGNGNGNMAVNTGLRERDRERDRDRDRDRGGGRGVVYLRDEGQVVSVSTSGSDDVRRDSRATDWNLFDKIFRLFNKENGQKTATITIIWFIKGVTYYGGVLLFGRLNTTTSVDSDVCSFTYAPILIACGFEVIGALLVGAFIDRIGRYVYGL